MQNVDFTAQRNGSLYTVRAVSERAKEYAITWFDAVEARIDEENLEYLREDFVVL